VKHFRSGKCSYQKCPRVGAINGYLHILRAGVQGEIAGVERDAGVNMADDQEDENDFQMIKRKKSSSLFDNNSQKQYRKNINPKRSLPLSLKSTRSKKKACSIETFLEKNLEKNQNGTTGTLIEGKDQLNFCPVCQLPFRILIGLSVEGHVQECVANYSESSGMVKFETFIVSGL
jgi:hypothetical protein